MRVIENEDLYETWRNESAGSVLIHRVGRIAGELKGELIHGHQTFHITPAERRMNEETFAEPSFNFFTNGTFTPVKLIESAEDFEKFKGNPNHLGEADMREFFKGKASKAFKDRIDSISNPIALARLLEVAKEEDATVGQVEYVKSRLNEISPATYTEHEVIQGTQIRPVIKQ